MVLRFVLTVVTLSAFVAVVAPPTALAAAEQPESRSVEIIVVGSERDLEILRTTLGERAFRGASTRWVRAPRLDPGALLERTPETTRADVRAWVDLSDENDASLYFADRTGERFLVRAVALPEGLSPLGREALGQVLELSVLALLEDDRIGMTREETTELLRGQHADAPSEPERDEAPEPEPEPSEPSDMRSSLAAEAFYAVRLFSDELSVVHGPGLGLGWLTEGELGRSLLWVSGQYELRERHVTPNVGVEWATVRVLAGAALSYRVARSSLLLGGRLGGGADFTTFTPKPGSAGRTIALERSGVSTVPVLRAAFEATLPLGERLSLSTRAVASVYPVRVHYDVAGPGARTRVLEPYRVQPGLELSLLLR